MSSNVNWRPGRQVNFHNGRFSTTLQSINCKISFHSCWFFYLWKWLILVILTLIPLQVCSHMTVCVWMYLCRNHMECFGERSFWGCQSSRLVHFNIVMTIYKWTFNPHILGLNKPSWTLFATEGSNRRDLGLLVSSSRSRRIFARPNKLRWGFTKQLRVKPVGVNFISLLGLLPFTAKSL